MINIMHFIKKICLSIIIISISISSIACSDQNEKILVTWMDTDGTLIESQTVDKNYDPTKRALPNDSKLWHYTEWTTSQSGNIIVCTAKRTAMHHITWKDYNGGVIDEIFISENESTPTLDLPSNNDKWIYKDWEKSTNGNEIFFQATRKPNINYFIGNVFQIVVKDEKENPLGSGSGFVINDDGWFITNNHVMENGYTATAFFDIKDNENGHQYTQLKILGGVYCDDKKDIFIGKLENYRKIKNHYTHIEFTENYTIGETSYSVGYPNSSTTIEINQGSILEEYSDIYSKIDGVYYILSNSYIAPGSSGGILLNENFEVIGITTIGLYSDSNKNYYTSGGSVPYFMFKQHLQNLKINSIKSLIDMYIK